MVATWADRELATAAERVLDKVRAVLPADRRDGLDGTAMFALSFQVKPEHTAQLALARQAVDARKKLAFTYEDRQQRPSRRTVRPLGLYFWGSSWTIAAWCELRRGFRNFRLDRLGELELLDDTFALESPVTLDDFVRAMEAEVSGSKS
jgi:predicted DNA-binding transcriptional regulator YafY